MKYLLFGIRKDCDAWTKERNIPLQDWKHVRRESDYYGYNDVKLIYLGRAETVDEYELYHNARRYFEAKGISPDNLV